MVKSPDIPNQLLSLKQNMIVSMSIPNKPLFSIHVVARLGAIRNTCHVTIDPWYEMKYNH